MTLEALKARAGERGNQHASQPRLVSLTQPTELGVLYSVDEVPRDLRVEPARGPAPCTSTVPGWPTPPRRSTRASAR